MRFINCSYRKKLPEGGEMRQTVISSPCLPRLLFLISWNHSTCESVLCFISGLFWCRARQSSLAGTGDESCALSTARAAPRLLHPPWHRRDQYPLPVHRTSTVPQCWASLTHLFHALPCTGRDQQLLKPMMSLSWTETTDHCASPYRCTQTPWCCMGTSWEGHSITLPFLPSSC